MKQKRRVVIQLVLLSAAFLAGCSSVNRESDEAIQGSSIGAALRKKTEEVASQATDIVSPEVLQETDNYIEHYNVDRYFLKGSNNSSLYEVTYQIFEGFDTEEMLVDFIFVAELENGMLYKMQIEDLSVDRFPIYLYETDEKIYRLWDFSETDIVIEEDELIQNTTVVWQNQEMSDLLSEEERGEHHYILVEGDKCESHYYQYNDRANVVGYWEAFYWEEGKGLVQYRSGFSALADLVEMTKIE